MSSEQPGAIPPPPGSTPPGPAPAPGAPAPGPAPGPYGAPAPQQHAPQQHPPQQHPGAPVPPSYPPQGPPTPGHRSSSGGGGGGGRTALIITIVLLVLVLVGGLVTALILLLSGGETDDAPAADEGYLTVVEEFTRAFDDRDCAVIVELHPSRFDDEEDCDDRFPYDDADEFSIEVDETTTREVDDEDAPTEATVRVTYTVIAESSSGRTRETEYVTDFELEKDGEDWVIIKATDLTDSDLEDDEDEDVRPS